MSAASSTHGRSASRRNALMKVLKVIVPLAISVILIWWLLKKVDISQIETALREHVDFKYIAMMMALTVVSHMIRGIRWGIQLRAAGLPRIPVMAESCSIFGAYALNLVFPYLGEAWRCVYISDREKVKLSTVVGTDIGDRISDLIVILMLVGLTVVVARPAMLSFLHTIDPKASLAGLDDPHALIIAAVVILLLALVWYFGRNTKTESNIRQSAARIYRGFAVLFHMQGTGLYIVLTLGIWICYFFQTYFCIFAFPYTRELVTEPGMYFGALPALVVFVFGSCSMAIPSNGGLGPWNIAVVLGLTLYGIDSADATAWSLVYWGWQTVAQIAAGLFAAFYIARERKQTAATT